MSGHIAPFDEIYKLGKKYHARTYIDDAHGLGVIGLGGRGTADHFGLKPDILMGTFSKSLASQGGYICCNKEVEEWIRVQAKTFMFSAALAPASAAAAKKALEVLREEPELVTQVRHNAGYLKSCFDQLGFDTMNSSTCIVPVMIGDDRTSLYVCQKLLKLGIFTTPVVPPAVPKGQSMIRCSVMATHTREDLDKCVDAFSKLSKEIIAAATNPNTVALADSLKGNVESDSIDSVIGI